MGAQIEFKRVSEDTYLFYEDRDYYITIKRLLETDDEGLDQYLVGWSFRADGAGKMAGGRFGIFSRGKSYGVEEVHQLLDVGHQHCRRIMRFVKQVVNINMLPDE